MEADTLIASAGTATQADLRIAIAHEWLVAFAGSERCVLELLRVYPDAELLTTVIDRAAVPAELARARPSLLQHLPGAAAHHEWFLPLMPLAWRLHAPSEPVDVVVSSSHACAKGVGVPAGTPHLCYCHTPMRYAWSFDEERDRFPGPTRPAARQAMRWFRRWDRATAARVSQFVANSTAVAARIERSFGRSSRVIHPPVRTDFFTPGGEREDFFLYVGRLVAYKRADLVVDTFAGLPHRLVVVGEGPLGPALKTRATANVTFAGSVDDERLRDLYRRTRALVYPVNEDFGISMAEAQACGAPVIGLATGGATDIVEPDRTGWLLDFQSAAALRSAVERAASEQLDSQDIVRAAQRFSADRFRKEMRLAVEACAGRRA